MTMRVSGEGALYYGKEKEAGLRFTANGLAMISFSVAFYQGKEKEKGFVRATAFGDIAERIAEYVSHGDRVVIEGRLSHRKTDEGGEYLSMVVDDLGISLRYDGARAEKAVRKDVQVAEDPMEAPF